MTINFYKSLILIILFNIPSTVLASDTQNVFSDCSSETFGEICDDYIILPNKYSIKSEDEAIKYLDGEWELDLTAFSKQYYIKRKKPQDIEPEKAKPNIFLSSQEGIVKVVFAESPKDSEPDACEIKGAKLIYEGGTQGTIYSNPKIRPENCSWQFLVKDKERLALMAYDTFIPMRKVK